MTLTPLAVTAITNFLLASEAFFVSGLYLARRKTPRSAAWFWQLALLLLSLTALIGGIDHGFFEVHGQTPVRKVIEHTNWFFIGLLTFCVALTTIQQFVRPAWQMYGYVAAGLQLVIYSGLLLVLDNFLMVLINYAPVMFLLLIANVVGLRSGNGAWAMIIGIILSFVASGLQAARVDILDPFNQDSLYHTGMMLAVLFLYWGGLRLKGLL